MKGSLHVQLLKTLMQFDFEEQNNGIEEEEQINLHSDVGEEEAGE